MAGSYGCAEFDDALARIRPFLRHRAQRLQGVGPRFVGWEDLLQEAEIAAWTAYPRFVQATATLDTFIARRAHGAMLDHLRKCRLSTRDAVEHVNDHESFGEMDYEGEPDRVTPETVLYAKQLAEALGARLSIRDRRKKGVPRTGVLAMLKEGSDGASIARHYKVSSVRASQVIGEIRACMRSLIE